MNAENNKLGRGLEALLSADTTNENKSFKFINVSEIHPNKNQPRKNFKQSELNELAASIKQKGILQPIVVRQTESNQYEIIAGERRWRATQLAEVHEIPAYIKDMSDELAREAALIENIQRENLNPVEEAKAYQAILKHKNSNYDKLSDAVNKSKSHISNTIRLLELEDEILNYVISGKLSMGHARALIGVPNAK